VGSSVGLSDGLVGSSVGLVLVGSAVGGLVLVGSSVGL